MGEEGMGLERAKVERTEKGCGIINLSACAPTAFVVVQTSSCVSMT